MVIYFSFRCRVVECWSCSRTWDWGGRMLLTEQWNISLGMKFNDLDPRVVAMYQGLSVILQRYRSGKLPKAFKLVPKLQNWEQILYITSKLFKHSFLLIWGGFAQIIHQCFLRYFSGTIKKFFQHFNISTVLFWSVAIVTDTNRWIIESLH